jgi:hypothetical protein
VRPLAEHHLAHHRRLDEATELADLARQLGRLVERRRVTGERFEEPLQPRQLRAGEARADPTRIPQRSAVAVVVAEQQRAERPAASALAR